MLGLLSHPRSAIRFGTVSNFQNLPRSARHVQQGCDCRTACQMVGSADLKLPGNQVPGPLISGCTQVLTSRRSGRDDNSERLRSAHVVIREPSPEPELGRVLCVCRDGCRSHGSQNPGNGGFWCVELVEQRFVPPDRVWQSTVRSATTSLEIASSVAHPGSRLCRSALRGWTKMPSTQCWVCSVKAPVPQGRLNRALNDECPISVRNGAFVSDEVEA